MGRSANRPILFEIAPPDLPRRALLYVNKRPDQPPLKTASLSSDLSGFDDFTADGGCPKPPPKPWVSISWNARSIFPAKDPNSLLSRTCSISNLKKNTTRMASPTLTTPATARLFVAVAAAVAAPTAVIAHPCYCESKRAYFVDLVLENLVLVCQARFFRSSGLCDVNS
jgi:hypothetical protein